jgi:hypothetical protein
MADEEGFVVVTAEERPDLWAESRDAFPGAWPEYNLHGDVAGEYFGALVPRFARYQVILWDPKQERVVARGRTIPFAWDETLDGLPAGVDLLGLRALEAAQPPTALSALSAEVASDHRRRGLSERVLAAMVDVARKAGLAPLVAPVRPTRKDRYPLIPIEEYARWVRADGLPFDPWIRVHVRMNATTLRAEPESMRITGSVAEWTEWTGLEFPADGQYVFPGGLAPLDVRDGIGRYWEPNVWMCHEVSRSAPDR